MKKNTSAHLIKHHNNDGEPSCVQNNLSPSKKISALAKLFSQRFQQTLRLMVGIPDYTSYLNHCQQHHPDQTPMSYETFFRERQEARYSKKKGRISCC